MALKQCAYVLGITIKVGAYANGGSKTVCFCLLRSAKINSRRSLYCSQTNPGPTAQSRRSRRTLKERGILQASCREVGCVPNLPKATPGLHPLGLSSRTRHPGSGPTLQSRGASVSSAAVGGQSHQVGDRDPPPSFFISSTLV